MKGLTLTINVEKKPTHTCHSLACRNNPLPKKQGVIRSLHNRDAIKYHKK